MSSVAGKPALLQFGAVLLDPQAAIADIGAHPPSSARAFFGAAVWFGLCPPIFAYIGTRLFGWRLGVETLFLPPRTVLVIAAAYFAMLLFGFLSTAFVARWMSTTYGADGSLQRCIALVTLVGAPLTIGSVVHLYPNAFVNVIVLVPTLIWSMYLLYRGLPVVLKTDPGRGMLMASSLIAYLLVSWVTLLGITAVLWSHGIGPQVAT
jgi:Yip1-like protein